MLYRNVGPLPLQFRIDGAQYDVRPNEVIDVADEHSWVIGHRGYTLVHIQDADADTYYELAPSNRLQYYAYELGCSPEDLLRYNPHIFGPDAQREGVSFIWVPSDDDEAPVHGSRRRSRVVHNNSSKMHQR